MDKRIIFHHPLTQDWRGLLILFPFTIINGFLAVLTSGGKLSYLNGIYFTLGMIFFEAILVFGLSKLIANSYKDSGVEIHREGTMKVTFGQYLKEFKISDLDSLTAENTLTAVDLIFNMKDKKLSFRIKGKKWAPEQIDLLLSNYKNFAHRV